MAEIINLNQARKRRDAALRKRRADENAARHGQPKIERQIAESRSESERRRLDGHQRGGDLNPPIQDPTADDDASSPDGR